MQQMGRSIEIVHLRPSAGFLRHSMDFSATASYLDEGYRYTIKALEARRRGRRPAAAAVAGAPVYH